MTLQLPAVSSLVDLHLGNVLLRRYRSAVGAPNLWSPPFLADCSRKYCSGQRQKMGTVVLCRYLYAVDHSGVVHRLFSRTTFVLGSRIIVAVEQHGEDWSGGRE